MAKHKPSEKKHQQRQGPVNSEQAVLPGTALQRKAANAPSVTQMASMADKAAGFVQRRSNATGMPDQLKNGIENLSGHAMDDVKVHYNSTRPAQLQAHAYAQGNQIHLGPGQEKHLPHEAWHVVQQKQGRVQATTQAEGVPINDNAGLEQEADVMGSHVAKSGLQEKVEANRSWVHKGMRTVQMAANKRARGKRARRAPKALGYRGVKKTRRLALNSGFKRRQFNLGRSRRLHIRHIIPHSDLQNWIMTARERGGAGTQASLMRRIITDLILAFGNAGAAQSWQTDYQAYEQSGSTRSLLQDNPAAVRNAWNLIEWHGDNLFLGHAGVNEAIQNRFDAGQGAIQNHSLAHVRQLYGIWHQANTLLGLSPTALAPVQVYSTHLRSYINTMAASHNGSRPLIAARGWLGRSDYLA